MKFIAASLGVTLACVALGYYPTVNLGGEEAVVPMLVGCGMSLAASWIGAIPLIVATRHKKQGDPSTIMAGTALRFVVVLVLTLVVALGSELWRTPLLLWVAISHMVLLIPDTFLALRLNQSTRSQE